MKLSIVPVVLMALQVAAFAQSNSKCSDMAKFRSPGVTLEITRAVTVPAGGATPRLRKAVSKPNGTLFLANTTRLAPNDEFFSVSAHVRV
jgi:hypothetical protein